MWKFGPIFPLKSFSLILKTHFTYWEVSQKCIFHALYASTIPLSHHFVTEQQQKYPFFYVFPRLSWVALIICPITCRNLYNVNVDLSEKQQLFLSRFRQIYKIIISKGTRDLTTEADSLTTHGMRKHSATTLSDETRNFIRYWDFLRLKSFETDTETFFETETDTLKNMRKVSILRSLQTRCHTLCNRNHQNYAKIVTIMLSDGPRLA